MWKPLFLSENYQLTTHPEAMTGKPNVIVVHFDLLSVCYECLFVHFFLQAVSILHIIASLQPVSFCPGKDKNFQEVNFCTEQVCDHHALNIAAITTCWVSGRLENVNILHNITVFLQI